MIPTFALLIALVVMVGIFIVAPIAKAISQRPGDEPVLGQDELARLAGRLAETEERLEGIERSLRRVEEAQDFHRQLDAPPLRKDRPSDS